MARKKMSNNQDILSNNPEMKRKKLFNVNRRITTLNHYNANCISITIFHNCLVCELYVMYTKKSPVM